MVTRSHVTKIQRMALEVRGDDWGPAPLTTLPSARYTEAENSAGERTIKKYYSTNVGIRVRQAVSEAMCTALSIWHVWASHLHDKVTARQAAHALVLHLPHGSWAQQQPGARDVVGVNPIALDAEHVADDCQATLAQCCPSMHCMHGRCSRTFHGQAERCQEVQGVPSAEQGQA